MVQKSTRDQEVTYALIGVNGQVLVVVDSSGEAYIFSAALSLLTGGIYES